MSFGSSFVEAFNVVRAADRADAEAAAAKEDRAFQASQRARMVAQQQREDLADADIRTAAAPVQVAQVAAPGELTVGANGPELATAPAFQAGGKRFATRMEADSAAADANKPEAQQARVVDSMRRNARFGDAAALESQDMQSRLARMQIGEAESSTAHKNFMRGVATSLLTNGWDGFARFATEKYSDGRNYTAQADGKGGATLIATDPEGKEVGRQTFAAPEDAIMFSASRADPTKWVEWSGTKQDRAIKADAVAADRAYKDRQLDLERRGLDIKEKALRMHGGGSAGAADPLATMPPAVKLAYSSDARNHDRIQSAITKAQAEGTWDPKTPGAQSLLSQSAVLEARMLKTLSPYMPGGNGGQASDPLGLFTPPAGAAPGQQAPTPSNPGAVVQPSAPPAQAPRAARMPTPSLPASLTGSEGPQKRREALAAKVPAAQQAYDQAAQELADAQAKGPMFVARARDKLTQARAALADAKQRAGM